MKKVARSIVAAILGYQVRKLYKNNSFKVVAVDGSIGKTSTKLAIATVLSEKLKVRYQEGNYNDLVTVPLVFFGEELPSLFNPFAWLRAFLANQKQVKNYPYEVVVLELGSDAPGHIAQFSKYLKVEIGVITAITPEHMAFFGNLESVAKEELAIGQFSSLVIANSDLCEEKYIKGIDNLLTYGIDHDGSYRLNLKGSSAIVSAGGEKLLEFEANDLSKAELYSRLAALVVGSKFGLLPDEITAGIKKIMPFAGRMQKLAGINGSTIIDDSYNASPEAVKLALDSLYNMKSSQKIAILGNMNEMGESSELAHEEIGKYCDPAKLELVATIGPDANKFLAAAAESKGCKVKQFDNPYEAGEFIKPLIKSGAVILVKGSQNGVFAEEAAKALLRNPEDSQKLVRQSDAWLVAKKKAFNR